MKLTSLLILLFTFAANGQAVLNKQLCDDSLLVNVALDMGNGNYVINWFSDFDGSVYEDDNRISFIISETGAIQIEYKVTDNNGCETFGKAFILVEDCPYWTIYFPNTFTPNEDPSNPTWFPKYENVYIKSVEIWNRWGELVHDSPTPWNGTYLGTMVQEDVYVCRVVYIANGNELEHRCTLTVLF